MSAADPVLEVRAAQGIRIHYRLAGPVSRALALIIDIVVIIALANLISLLMFLVIIPLVMFGRIGLEAAKGLSAATTILFFLLLVGYPIYMEWRMRGQTPGKRLLQLRVVDVNGRHLGGHQVVLRNLLRFVDILPGFYGLGGACALCTRRYQRLGDLLADTVVVNVRRMEPRVLRERHTREENSLRGHAHIEARLRKAVDPRRADLLAQAINRRQELDEQARLELYAELARDLCEWGAFPPELAADLSDEQLIRNALDILHRSRRET